MPLLCLIAPTAAAGSCPADLLTTQCNSVANKVPAVTTALPAGQSVEAGLSDADKESFEHLLGQGLRNSAAVRWVTTEFTKRAVVMVARMGKREDLRERSAKEPTNPGTRAPAAKGHT